MKERTAKLTLKVGGRSVQYEAGVDRVEAELHRLAAELLGSGRGDEPAVLSVTAPAPAEESAPPGGTRSADRQLDSFPGGSHSAIAECLPPRRLPIDKAPPDSVAETAN